MDFDAIAKTVVQIAVDSTKDQVNDAVDKLAASIVTAVQGSETSLDDIAVRDLVAPAVRRLADGVIAGLTPSNPVG